MPQAVGANRRVIDPSAQPADVASTVCVVRITGSRRPGVRKQGLGPAGFSGLALARDGRACEEGGGTPWLARTPQAAAQVALIRQVAEGTPDVARMNVGLGQVRSLLTECR